MRKTRIKTKDGFEKWLSKNYWFQDGRVQSPDPFPLPSEYPVPAEATIELAYQIKGNYKAYSTAVYKIYRLHLKDLEGYHYPAKESFSPDHCMEGVELLDSKNNISFTLDAPLIFTISCSEIIVEQLPDLIETVGPWLSEREINAKVRSIHNALLACD